MNNKNRNSNKKKKGNNASGVMKNIALIACGSGLTFLFGSLMIANNTAGTALPFSPKLLAFVFAATLVTTLTGTLASRHKQSLVSAVVLAELAYLALYMSAVFAIGGDYKTDSLMFLPVTLLFWFSTTLPMAVLASTGAMNISAIKKANKSPA